MVTKNLSLSTKLYISFLFIIVSFIFALIFSILQFMKIEEVRNHSYNYIVYRTDSIHTMRNEVSQYHLTLTKTFINPFFIEEATQDEIYHYGYLLTNQYQYILKLIDRYTANLYEDPRSYSYAQDIRMLFINSIRSDLNELQHLADNFVLDNVQIYENNEYFLASLINTNLNYLLAMEMASREQNQLEKQNINRATIYSIFIIFLFLIIVTTLVTLYFMRSFKDFANVFHKKEGLFKSSIKSMFNAKSFLVSQWDSNLNIVYGNDKYFALFGHNTNDEHMDNLHSIFPKTQPDGSDSLKSWHNNIKQVFKTEKSQEFAFILLSSDNNHIFVDISATLVNFENIPYVVLYINDRTELYTYISKLQKQKDLTNSILESSPLASIFLKEDFSVLNCNEAALLFLEFESKSLLKTRPLFANADEIKPMFETAFKEGRFDFDYVLQKISGDKVRCYISFVRLYSEDEETIVIMYIEDLSLLEEISIEQQKSQLWEQNSLTKSKFLARMSHEIRTPITAVLGISELQLQNTQLTLNVEEAFSKIYDSADMLLQIINDILDLSKIESDKMNIISKPYDVFNLASDTIQLNVVYLDNNSINFNVDVDENMPSTLLGDLLRLKQITNNILSNAFKYTEIGRVNLKMFCEYPQDSESEGDLVNIVIIVSDTGKGMTKQQINHIFDEYQRFHEEEIFTYGTGLGMPIAHNLVTLMGGTINIESTPNIGTIVTVSIPQTISNSQKMGTQTAQKLKDYSKGTLISNKKMNFTPEPMPYGKVLIVDDIDINIYVVRGLLEFYKLQIESVNNGYAAINKIKEGNEYDIIFMDHMMPGLNGIETTHVLRNMGYSNCIIALTANALIGQAENFMRNGFDGFLAKPIQTINLNSVLHRFIKETRIADDDLLIIENNVQEDEREVGETRNKTKSYLEDYLNRSDIYVKIRKDFLRNHRNTMREVERAIEENDFKTAMRLVHTLKSLGSLIGEEDLTSLAASAEASLTDWRIPHDIIISLNQLIDKIIVNIEEELKDIVPETEEEIEYISYDKAKFIFDKLEYLLDINNFEAKGMIPKIKEIKGTEELVDRIENFEFEEALEVLIKLKKDMERH